MGRLISFLRIAFAALLFPAAAQAPSRRIAALSASLSLVMVACGAESPANASFVLEGTIQTAPYLDVDGDTNDPYAPLLANNGATEAEVQALANPVLLNGFVAQVPTGITGTRFAASADVDDVFTAQLEQGQYVSLRIIDFSAADLDLYLIDPVDYSLAGVSINVGEYESLRVPRSGRFFIQVRAVEGASSYVLQLGDESFLSDARRYGSSNVARDTDAERWTVSVARAGLEPGWYASEIEFSDSGGGRTRLPVSMQVAEPLGPGNTGKLYVSLYQAESVSPWRTVAAEPVAAGRYHYQLAEVPPGQYWLAASSDVDYDGVLCEPGEICGGFMDTGQAPITLATDLLELDFEVTLHSILDGALQDNAVPAAVWLKAPASVQ